MNMHECSLWCSYIRQYPGTKQADRKLGRSTYRDILDAPRQLEM